MTKQAGRVSKRLIVIIVSVLVFIGLGAGGYYGYQWYQSQKKTASAVQQKAAGYHITGNQDLATTYISLLDAGKTAEAQKLFSDRVAKEPNADAKLTLLTQAVQLALANSKPDAALTAAQQAISIRADDTTYAQAATVYVAKRDTAQQIVYLQKAIDFVSATDRPDKAQLLEHYNMQLTSAQKIQASFQGSKK